MFVCEQNRKVSVLVDIKVSQLMLVGKFNHASFHQYLFDRHVMMMFMFQYLLWLFTLLSLQIDVALGVKAAVWD